MLARNEPTKVADAAARLAELDQQNGQLQQDGARLLAQANAAAPDESASAEYARQSLELLSQAEAVGHFADADIAQQLQADKVWDPLRELPEFQALLQRVAPAAAVEEPPQPAPPVTPEEDASSESTD